MEAVNIWRITQHPRIPYIRIMSAPENNQFWKQRAKHGRDKIFETPELLWESCVEYFQWTEDNPLKEDKVFHNAGTITHAEVNKMRAMTIGGLCIFLDIVITTWENYKDRQDYLDVITRVELIIKNQKFTGAAADLLNPNIIARDLGLADKKDHTHEFPGIKPIEWVNGEDKP